VRAVSQERLSENNSGRNLVRPGRVAAARPKMRIMAWPARYRVKGSVTLCEALFLRRLDSMPRTPCANHFVWHVRDSPVGLLAP
jgi:hypothetical protein